MIFCQIILVELVFLKMKGYNSSEGEIQTPGLTTELAMKQQTTPGTITTPGELLPKLFPSVGFSLMDLWSHTFPGKPKIPICKESTLVVCVHPHLFQKRSVLFRETILSSCALVTLRFRLQQWCSQCVLQAASKMVLKHSTSSPGFITLP